MPTGQTEPVGIPRPFLHLESVMASHDLTPRVAPAGMTLPVPWHIRAAGIAMGAATIAVGAVMLLTLPRPGGVLDTSVLQLIRPALGWAFVLIGLAVLAAHLTSTARASAHGVAAVAHLVHCVALFVSVAVSDLRQVTVVSILSVFAWVAHGGCSLDYWKRGYR